MRALKNLTIAVVLATLFALAWWAMTAPSGANSDRKHRSTTTSASTPDSVDSADAALPPDLDVSASDTPVSLATDADPDSTTSLSTHPTEYAIEGQITTVDGAPLAGARIEVRPFERTMFAHQAGRFLAELNASHPAIGSAVSGGNGTFRIAVDAPGRYLLEATAGGYDTAIEGPIRLTAAEPVSFLSIPLSMGFAIDGRVVDPSGDSVPDVALFLMKKNRSRSTYFTHRTTSIADGSFRFDGLDAGEYVLMVPPGKGGSDRSLGVLVTGVSAPSSDLLVRLESGRRYRGRVVDENNRPIADADITALNPVSYDQAKTGDDGRFELHLSGDDADLVVSKPGYLLYEERIFFASAGDTPERLLQLETGARLTGRLQYPDGHAVADCEVGLLQASNFLGNLQTTKTDADGRFAFTGVSQSTGALLLPKLPGWWLPFDRATIRPGQGYEGDDLTLVATTTFSGTVSDEQGAPIHDAWVALSPLDTGIASRAFYWLRGEQEAWTDADGRFVFDDVLIGATARLRASYAHAAPTSMTLSPITSAPIDIELQAGASLVLDIVTEDGAPPDSAAVIAEWPGSRAIERRANGTFDGGERYLADSRGQVTIEHVPAGTATLYVLAQSYVPQRVAIRTQSGEVARETITLKRGGVLRAVVTGADGEPLPMVFVRLAYVGGAPNASQPMRRRTGPDGICLFSSLESGRYRVSATNHGQTRSEQVDITNGDAVVQVEIELR